MQLLRSPPVQPSPADPTSTEGRDASRRKRGFLDDLARWSAAAAALDAAARRPDPSAETSPAPAPCLTHHQIVVLVAPFVRAGYVPDLGASDRAARRLVFKPVHLASPAGRDTDHDADNDADTDADRSAASALAGIAARDGAPPVGMTETLELSSPRPGFHRLTRRLRLDDDPSGRLEAVLQADGRDPGALLARLRAAPRRAQFRIGAGWRLALHQRLQGRQCWPDGAVLQVAGWTLAMHVPGTAAAPHVSAAIDLRPDDGPAAELPDDLLAVLGWDWSVLKRAPHGRGWSAAVRLRGIGSARSRDALLQLQRAARHLARTLAEPPRRFHDRLAGARLGVWLRRAIPWGTAVVLALEASFAGAMKESRDSLLVAALLLLPVLLMALYLWRSERPGLEFPPWPRRVRAASWHGGG